MNLPFLNVDELIKELDSRNLYNLNIQKALIQAVKSHKDQRRTNGNTYLGEHIYPVTLELLSIPEVEYINEQLIIGALLHDAIEDDEDFNEEICLKEFGKEILHILIPITKSKSDNSHELSQQEKYNVNAKYLSGLENAPFESKLIKLSDRYNNLSCCVSILETHPAKANRYIKETRELFLPFAKKYSEHFYFKLIHLLDNVQGK
jgi:(p)ppGpp synthase/HD superfamily hydrolase